VKPYFEDLKAGIRIFNCDWRELDDETLRADGILTDPPYGIGESAGKSASRGKPFGTRGTTSRAKQLAYAKDYGDLKWDDETPTEQDINRMRSLAKYQIVWGGNYFILPPSKCWLVWDKVNGKSDFADCELAWTNLDKAVRKFTWMWNGMLKEEPEFRTHSTQKPRALFSWCLTQFPDGIKSILDPYAGVCTTAVCCKAVGLSCICVEREEKYAEDGAKRLEQEVFNWE
jgi:DNA modification methylase